MHTSEAADEPGLDMDPRVGQILHAEPTITIPSDAQPIWSLASEFDAYQEVDALDRYDTALVVGGNTVLPYQLGLQVTNVTVYNTTTQTATPLQASQYTVSNGQVDLIGFPNGTAFTVTYFANPVWVAWRRAGGRPHDRPFGAGTDALPKRFRAMALDLWLRARNQSGISVSPNAL
jgi:hypothetical protein